MDCIFCQIAAGKIPADILHRDKDMIAFRDIHPQAPVHVLIIPVEHIPSVAHLNSTQLPLMGRMVEIANKLAVEQGIAKNGYRLVTNCGKQGGQLVPHLHLHLLGGRQLSGQLG